MREHASPTQALERAVHALVNVIRSRRGDVGASSDGATSAAEGRIRASLERQSESWPDLDSHWLGAAYQRALAESDPDDTARPASRRTRTGAFYTPRALVQHLLDHALDPVLEGTATLPRVLDPACGCGAFLVEAARRIRAKRPESDSSAIGECLVGLDLDPLAAALCRLALWLELGAPAGPESTFHERVLVCDSLLEGPASPAFDVVLGNPPFLSQLAAATARTPAAAAKLRERFGPSIRPYTDPAALFLQLALERVREGGRVGMILPVSVLASRDALAVRDAVTRDAAIRSLWLDTDGIFPAAVRTVAITLERGEAPGPIERCSGSGFAPGAPRREQPRPSESWGPLVADLAGVPTVALASRGTLADLAEITAGFRDEYYAVVGGLREASEAASNHELPVATVGMIEPCALRWGDRPVRIGGAAWIRPCVSAEAGGHLARVIAQQRRPKLLVATQTKVLEAAPDETGRFIALTPTILIFPRDPSRFWHIGAAIFSPPAAAWVAAQAFGTARALGAIKPSASLLRGLPLPTDESAWDAAAGAFRDLCDNPSGRTAAHYSSFVRAACSAHGLGDHDSGRVLAWWLDRLVGARA